MSKHGKGALTPAGSPVTWEKTGEEPNALLPGTVDVGSTYCAGCGHSAHNARWASAENHAANCNH